MLFLLIALPCVFGQLASLAPQHIAVNGGFEDDKFEAEAHGGTLLNFVPKGWIYGHAVAVISYKTFSRYYQPDSGEFFLAMETTGTAVVAQSLNVPKNTRINSKFNVLAFCVGSSLQCPPPELIIYAAKELPVLHSPPLPAFDSASFPLERHALPAADATEMFIFNASIVPDGIWNGYTVSFVTPFDDMNFTISVSSPKPRSATVLLDNVEIIAPVVVKLAPVKPHSAPSVAQVPQKNSESFSDAEPEVALESNVVLESSAGLSTPATFPIRKPDDYDDDGDAFILKPKPKPAEANDPREPIKDSPLPPPTINLSKPAPPPPLYCPVSLDLMDKWGDGWDTAFVYISQTTAVHTSLQYKIVSDGQTAVVPPVSGSLGATAKATVFLKPNTIVYLRIRSFSNTLPKEFWEIYWLFNVGRISYLGDYNTVVTIECLAGGTPTAVIKDVLNGASHGQCTSCTPPEYVPHTGPVLGSAVPKPPPAPPRPLPGTPHPLTFELLNSAGRGWFNDTIESTQYVISDASRTSIVASGTLCGDLSKAQCQEKLPDGDYVLRVDGNLDRRSGENSWEFCGVLGAAREELSFSMVNGKCVAGVGMTLQEFVATSLSSSFASSPIDEKLASVLITDQNKATSSSSSSEHMNHPDELISKTSVRAADSEKEQEQELAYATAFNEHMEAVLRGENAVLLSLIPALGIIIAVASLFAVARVLLAMWVSSVRVRKVQQHIDANNAVKFGGSAYNTDSTMTCGEASCMDLDDDDDVDGDMDLEDDETVLGTGIQEGSSSHGLIPALTL